MKTLSLAAIASLAIALPAAADHHEGEGAGFTSKTIDLGCVVSDLEASIEFYTEAIGFTLAGGFEVPADFAKEAGLTDGKKLEIKVLTLGEGEGATKLKLMQIPGSGGAAKNDHIDTTLGFSYLTIMVASTDAALERLAAAGVKPIADGPVPLPDAPSLALTIVRDPDGNFVELIGPKPTK